MLRFYSETTETLIMLEGGREGRGGGKERKSNNREKESEVGRRAGSVIVMYRDLTYT